MFDNRAALRIAWRESRASAGKFLFVILAVAAGVGSLTGVKGFSHAFHDMLLKEARTLMAGDLMVRVFALPSPAQAAKMDALASQGIQRTWITETVTMLSPGAGDLPPVLISVKAVDPSAYPFYGEVKLDPPQPLGKALTPDHLAVSRDLLIRINGNVGDKVHVGGQDFIISGVVESEPDRMTGSLNVGPRVMMSRAALDRAGLLVPGSRASERFLFRIPPKIDIATINTSLKKVFPESLITDFRQTHPIIEDSLKRSTIFLSLISLIALIIGALGVSMAIDAHLRQKLDSIAVMKCLGAKSSQIIRIYTIQTLGLGAAGGVLGILGGLLVQASFPVLLARYFHLTPHLSLDPIAAVQGLLIGVLSALLFTLPPLISIRRIRPGLILRRDVSTDARPWTQRLREGIPTGLSVLVILAGIFAIAAWLSSDVRTGVTFVLGVVGAVAGMALVSWLFLLLLRWFGKRAAWRLSPALRHGIANLYRPGAHSQSALIALGVGVMFTLTVFLVQRGMLSEMVKSAPPGMPNVFLLDMTARNKDAVADLLAHQKGVEGKPELVGSVAARINSINGVILDRAKLKGIERRYASTMSVTIAGSKPQGTKLVSGQWWNPDEAHAVPLVSISEEASKVLHIPVGAHLEWSTPSRTFDSVVASIHRTEAIRLAARIEFYFTPGALDGLPMIYYGSARVSPPTVAALQTALYRRFPTVTVVNVADVLSIVQDVVDQISLIVRFISGFAILAGAVILSASIAGTRFRRIREVVILKTLGATRNRIAGIFSIEFLLLGAVAGLTGSLLATIFSSVLLGGLLTAEFHFDPWPNVAAIALTALIANVAGWLASFRILGQRPLAVLREE